MRPKRLNLGKGFQNNSYKYFSKGGRPNQGNCPGRAKTPKKAK